MAELTLPLTAPPVAPATPAPAPRKRVRLSSGGIVLLITSLLLAGSAFPSARVDLGGFLLHPCLLTMPVLVIIGMPRLRLINRRVLLAALIFMLLFAISTTQQPGMASEIVKPLVIFVLMFLSSLAVRNERDFRVAVGALAIVSLVLAVKAQGSQAAMGVRGLNPFMGIGNKNTYSLYSLPLFLLGGWLLVEKTGWRLRLLIGVSLLATLAATFETANRSGWLGLVLIGVMLVGYGRRIRAVVIVGLLAGSTYYVVDRYLSASVFEARLQQTKEGVSSDTLRVDLVKASFQLALENPLFGASPQRLPYELASRTHFEHNIVVDPHNVFGYVLGGSGFPATFAILAWLYTMWRRPRGTLATRDPAARSAHGLLRMMVVLWIVRGMFSAEILVLPAFAIAFGLALGLCRIRGAWRLVPA
jgi:O-antigen ligase